MSGLFGINTPGRKLAPVTDGSDIGITFDEIESFVEPAPKIANGARAPLRALSENPMKSSEFTPMLRSASKKHRLLKYETPVQKSDKSTAKFMDNSGLTPVNWTAKSLLPNDDSGSLMDHAKSSPAPAEMHTGAGGIREQEKAMDKMKNENFELKLKVYLLENQMYKSSPEHVQLALKENIEYKVQVQSLRTALARTRHDLTETQKKVASLGDQVSASLSIEECQLPHGMSDEDRETLRHMTEERDHLLDCKEDLEMQCRNLEDEVAELNSAREEMQHYKNDLNALQSELAATRSDLESTQAANEELEQQMEAMQEQLTELESQQYVTKERSDGDGKKLFAELRNEISEKAEVIANLQSTSQALKEQLTISESQRQTLTGKLETLESRNDSLEADVEDRSHQRLQTYTNIEQLELERGNLEIQVASLNGDNQRLRNELENLSQRLTDLQDELHEREEDIEELQGAAQEQSMEYRQLEEKLHATEDTKSRKSQEVIENLEEQIRSAKLLAREDLRTRNDLKAQIENLDRRVQESDTRIKAKDETLRKEQEQLQTQRSHIQSLERDAVTSQQKVSALSTRSRELELLIRELESNEDPDTTQVQDRLRDENNELREHLEDLQMQTRAGEEELDDLNEEIVRMRSALEDVRQSARESEVNLETSKQQAESLKSQLTESRRLLQASQDKIIVNEEARSKLQGELVAAKQSNIQHSQQIEALNTSLLSARARLSESQVSHKAELEALSLARRSESISAESRCAEIESRLSTQTANYERALEDAKSAHLMLERTNLDHHEQIASMESTIKQLSEKEENISLDQQRFKEALASESARHVQQEQAMKLQIEALETTKTDLKGQLESQYRELEAIRSDNRAISTESAQKEQLIISLRDNLRSHEEELSQAKVSLSDANHDSEQFRATSVTLEGRIKALMESLSSVRREFQDELLKRSDELFAESQKSQDLLDQLQACESRCLQGEQERKRVMLNLASAEERLMTNSEQLASLTEENQSLTSKLAEFPIEDQNSSVIDQERIGLRSQLSNNKELITSLKVKLKEITAQRDLFQQQVEEISQANSDYRNETAVTLRRLRDELTTAQNSLSIECERRNQVEADAESKLRETENKSDVERNVLRATIVDLEESLALAKQNHAALLSNVKAADAVPISMEQAIAELQRELDILKTRNTELEREQAGHHKALALIDELESQIADLEEDLEDFRHQAQARDEDAKGLLSDEKARHSKALDLLTAENDRLRDEISSIKANSGDLLSLQADLKHQSQEQASARGHLQRRHQASNAFAAGSTAVELSRREADEFKRQLEASKHELQAQRTLATSLQIDLSRQQKSDRRTQDELSRCMRHVKSLEVEISDKERKLNDFRRDVKIKSDQNSALEQRLQAIITQTTTNRPGPNSREVLFANMEKQKALHANEISGLSKMLHYLRSKSNREESFRSDLAYIKKYYDKQIASFEACNQANLSIIRQIGIYPDETFRKRKVTFKCVAQLVVATVRMHKLARAWSCSKTEKAKLDDALRMRRMKIL